MEWNLPELTGKELYIIMITRKDCILLLSELNSRGVDTSKYLQRCVKSQNVDLSVVKFINEQRQLDTIAFYEKLRKSYNAKKSMLYKNIVTCDEVDCTDSVLTTLAALNLQIMLFLPSVQNEHMFLENMRTQEINQALLNYSSTFDLVPCIQLLQIIKADLKAFEQVNKTTVE